MSNDNEGGGGSRVGRTVIGWVVFILILLLLNFVIFPLFNIPIIVY